MQPNPAFLGLTKAFWANVRTISQKVGYTVKPERQAGVTGQAGPNKVPTLAEAATALKQLGLTSAHLISDKAMPTDFGKRISDYFDYRAESPTACTRRCSTEWSWKS